MKRILFIFFVMIYFSSSYSQTKYYIYFKDKGVNSSTSLNKASSAYKIAESELTSKAIERRKKVMGDNYITFDDLPLNEQYVSKVESLGIKVQNKLKWFNAVTAYLTPAQIEQVNQLPFINKITAVKVLTVPAPINESLIKTPPALKKTQYSLDYGYSLIQDSLSQIPPVHDLGITGKGVVIGVLDAGFRWKASSVFNNIHVLKEYDFVQHDSITANQTDAENNIGQDSHGTAVLSIIGGYDPGKMIGPAFDATYILAKTEDIASEHHIEEDNYAAALEWMEGLGVDITTSSLGYNIFDSPDTSYTYQDMNGVTSITARAANLAYERGVSTFTAAGNEGNNTDWYYGVELGGNTYGKIATPGDAINMLTVGAVNSANQVATFSSRGPTSDGRIKPEIVAMGVSDAHVLAGSNTYALGSGTSFATPIAAGVAALLKSAYPFVTNNQIRQTFIECGDSAQSPDNNRGYGLVSAKRIINYPALQQINSSFTLYKIFVNSNGVNSSSVILYYSINGNPFQSVNMTYDGSLKYSYQFTNVNSGDSLKFYFIYNTVLSDIASREPSMNSSYYEFSFGKNDIYTVIQSDGEELPALYNLAQNYPNPFNPSTVIKYSISSAGLVTLKIYDILGRKVTELVNEVKNPGNYEVKFDGSKLASGIYFYTLHAGSFYQTKKMMLLK